MPRFLEVQGNAVSCHAPPRTFHQMDIFLSALKYSCCLKQLSQGPTPDSSNYIQVTVDYPSYPKKPHSPDRQVVELKGHPETSSEQSPGTGQTL